MGSNTIRSAMAFTDQGEKFDGRFYFHKRRNDLHERLADTSIKASLDPKYLIDWCATLMQLHRQLWGSLKKTKMKLEINNKKCELAFNDILNKKLSDIYKQLLNNIVYNERSDGEMFIKINREKIKHLAVELDKIHKKFAEVEYMKNYDLPRVQDPVIKTISSGFGT